MDMLNLLSLGGSYMVYKKPAFVSVSVTEVLTATEIRGAWRL